jgi:hypothetical protein
MNNLFGQVKKIIQKVVTSVAAAAANNTAMRNPPDTASAVMTENGKKASTSSSVEDGKNNENAIMVDTDMKNPPNTAENGKKAATSSSVEDGKSNENSTIVDTDMKNPPDTAENGKKAVTTSSMEDGKSENGKKAATSSSVEDGKSNENAIMINLSSDKEDGKKPSAKNTGVTTEDVISIKSSSDEDDFGAIPQKRPVGEVGNRAVRTTQILLRTGKKKWNQKDLTKEQFQSRLREEVIGGGFESDTANKLATNGNKDIPKKKPLPPPNNEWDNWWRVTVVTLIIPTHDIDGNEIPGVKSPVKRIFCQDGRLPSKLVENHSAAVIQSFLCGGGEFRPDSKKYAEQMFQCVFSDPKEDLLNIFVLQKMVMELLDIELIPKNRKAMALQIVGRFTQLLFLLNTEGGDWMGLQLGANSKMHECVQAVILNSLACFLYATGTGYNLAEPEKHYGWPVSVNGNELPTLKQLPFPEYIVATACLLIKQANQAMMGRGNALDRGSGLL